jgi:hypothetical protein
MRSSFWLCLIALGVSIGAIRVSSSLARGEPERPATVAPAPKAPPKAPKAKDSKKCLRALERLRQATSALAPGPNPAWVVDGYHLEPEAAQDAALRKAHESVRKYIHEHYPSLNWEPTLEQLQKARVIQVEGTPGTRQLDDGEEVQEAHAKVEMTRKYREGLQRLVLQQHTRQRQWFAARGLGGLVALLLVCAGYLRLDEATRGYYTRLLRLAALGVLVGVGVGLWLL